MNDLSELLNNIKACRLCSASFSQACNPILQFSSSAKLLLIGQAPGRITNELSLPFKDPSGDRLRLWLGIAETQFYDPNTINIMPMAFCYPGKQKSGSGDAPPPKICSETWHEQLLRHMPERQLTLLIGSYSAKCFLPEYDHLTDAIQQTCKPGASIMALPHPSPRNNIWLKKNPWFETKTLPIVRQRLKEVLN